MPENLYRDLKDQLERRSSYDDRDDGRPDSFKRRWEEPGPDIPKSKEQHHTRDD